MRLLRHIPNALTSMNLAVGMLGIYNVFVGDFTNSILFILVAGLFDFLDGFVARLVGADGDFGRELDSLADVVTFGALPAAYIFQWSSSLGNPDYLSYMSVAIVVFSALRLARFNLSEPGDGFQGLPTPANAIMLCTLGQLDLGQTAPSLYIPAIIVLSCFLLVSNLPMMSLKFKKGGFLSNIEKFIFLGAIVLAGALLGISAIPFVIPGYIFLSVVVAVTSKRRITSS